MSGVRAACTKLIHLPGQWGTRPAWSSACLREGGAGRTSARMSPIVPSETGPSRPSGPSKIWKQLQHLDRTRLPTVPALSAWRPSPQGWSAVLEGRASLDGRAGHTAGRGSRRLCRLGPPAGFLHTSGSSGFQGPLGVPVSVGQRHFRRPSGSTWVTVQCLPLLSAVDGQAQLWGEQLWGHPYMA